MLQYAFAVNEGLVVRISNGAGFARMRWESQYNRVDVSRSGSVVRIRRVENGATVSAIDLAHPCTQVFPSTATLFAAALVKGDPRRVFNIGLGAAAFSRLFLAAFKKALLTTIEIDAMMLKLARTHTAYRQRSRDKVIIGDGRRHLERSKRKFDWIVLDAFIRRSEVPSHLATLEFYRMVASKLSDDGVFVANLVNGDAQFPRHVRTLRAGFSQMVFFNTGGRIIVTAVKYAEPKLPQQVANVDVRKLPNLTEWGVDFSALKAVMVEPSELSLPPRSRILRD